MKQDKILTIILAVANVILIVFCAVFYLQIDRQEPTFEFQAVDTVYRSGMEEVKLLRGITAYDSTDGDVTTRIVIEKMIEDEKSETLVVYYAVSDRAGNVAKCSRVFPAVLLSPKQNSHDEAELLMEAGVNADLEDGDEKEENEILVEPTTVPEETPSPSPIVSPTPTPTQEPTPEPEAAHQAPAPTQNPAAPVLTLKSNQVTVERGKNPPWVNVIGSLTDDKDSYETLFYNLKVSKYNVDEEGSYPVSVYTEDSDGNQSVPVSMTIIVQ